MPTLRCALQLCLTLGLMPTCQASRLRGSTGQRLMQLPTTWTWTPLVSLAKCLLLMMGALGRVMVMATRALRLAPLTACCHWLRMPAIHGGQRRHQGS